MGYSSSAHDRLTAAEHLIDGLASAVQHTRLELKGELQKQSDHVNTAQKAPVHDQNCIGKTLHTRADLDLSAIRSSLNRVFPQKPTWKLTVISAWPTQALVIIAYYLQLQERVSLANSCRRIQAALYSEPSLWNRVGIFDTSFAHDRSMWLRLRQILRRAARATSRHLLVTMYPDTNSTSIQWSVIGEFLQSGTTLNLMAADPPPYWSGIYNRQPIGQKVLIRDLFCDPSAAPHLERLSLALGTSQQGNTWILPSEFLCGNLGRLKSCRLQLVSLLPEFPYLAFANLREFSYFGVHSSELHTFRFLRTLICSMPNLETLGLSQLGFSHDGSLADSAPLDALNLRFVCTQHIWCGAVELARLLINVSVVLYLDNTPSDVGSLFEVWPTEDLALAIRDGQHHFQGLPLREDAEDALSAAASKQSFQFSIWSTGAWTLSGLEKLSLADEHACRITLLSIHERQWESIFDALPHLPCLSVLSVVLSICAEERQSIGDDSGIFWSDMVAGQSPDTIGSPTRFLALKELNIYAGESLWLPVEERLCCLHGVKTQLSCACVTGTTIALCDVADFIRRMPLVPAMRLKRVNLHGIEAIVDVEPGKALCDLLTIVDEVDGTSAAMPTIMRIDRASRFDEVLGESSDRALYKNNFLSPSNSPRRLLHPTEMFWDMF